MYTLRVSLFGIAALIGLAISQSAQSHPHAFVDMSSKIIIEEEKLVGFNIRWLFDPVSSAPSLYELRRSHNNDPDRLAKRLVNNLIDENYFSQLYLGQQQLDFNKQAQNASVEVIGQSLVLNFRLMLETAQPLAGNSFSLMSYDPTYFINMRYKNLAEITINDSNNCKLELIEPTISRALINSALLLDLSQREDRSIGIRFAQKLLINCP